MFSTGRPARTCGVLVWAVLGANAALAGDVLIRRGGEFQANTFTLNHQSDPAIAVDADGDFVVSWTDNLHEENSGIFANRFSSAGATLASEFHVNTYTVNLQTGSSVAIESNGDFVIVWQSYTQAGNPFGYSIFGQRFNASGARLGTEFQVNSYTLAYAFRARIASDSDGDFVVVWQLQGAVDGSGDGIFGRRFDSSGAALASEFLITSFTAGSQRNPSVGIDSDGDFIVVWDSNADHDGAGYGIFAQRFGSAGVRQGIEFQINSYTVDHQTAPWVAAEADGDFVVAWQSIHQDGEFPYGDLGIFARRWSSAGVALASEFQVNVYTTGYQRFPRVAADDGGRFVVTWESQYQDGEEEGVFARTFAANGAPIGSEFQVNSFTEYGQLRQTVDWDGDRDFVVAWYSEPGQDGNAYGVFAQRFAAIVTLDIDGDRTVAPLTDGLLHLRHRFGFFGNTLINGAIAPDCGRCDADLIAKYFDDAGLEFDIDGNGELDPLTDGLLLLRYMFGFRGATLIAGAIGGGATRITADMIEAYIETLL